ncbi:unnamed protein product [Brachionus calyciflorus]|uniref:LIM zinc-binding domain-containing protein n=1 Tax=Brachionus calyciflorus TaxID=104777 RepID=A0A813M6M9_9BILA|nr:unnamed protein product [Brachionus calyciflorus]
MMEKYDWIPPCLDISEIKTFFKEFPIEKIPIHATQGINERKKNLFRQIPKQDISPNFCDHLKNKKTFQSYLKFTSKRDFSALDIGICMKNSNQDISCKNCDQNIEKDSIYVHASDRSTYLSKNYKNLYHPDCFKCSTCNEFLADLVYCMDKGKLYCMRHYGELFKSRCAICDEVS